jgi:hypothetical protein
MSGIYLSYRRMEAGGHAGRLADHLSRHFGPGSVFRDIDTIRRGEDFAQAIESALNTCDVVLVVIGNTWATGTGEDSRCRLDDPKDWVRLEVAAALRRNILVIPVLVDGARLPDPARLPEELRSLCRRNACELSDLRWAFDVGELVKDLKKVVRSPKRFKVPGVKDKRLRWFAGGTIILALLLGMTLVGPSVFQRASQVQNERVKSRKVTESPVPEWLVGWWKVTWRGQAYYYFFDHNRQVKWTQILPQSTSQPPLIASDTGNFAVELPNSVTIRWGATGSVEKFSRVPATDDEEEMSGKWNGTEPLTAVKM